MQTVTRIADLRATLQAWRQQGLRIGFVPTMGNLHDGHLSLIDEARRRADRIVSSVFVNPLQFGPNEDFDRYPRTPEDDARLLESARCDLLFLPAVEEMYPQGRDQATRVFVRGISDILCGAVRPGHFEGVATVVAKLFGIVQPDVAVFGEKDFQQFTILKRMTQDLSLPIEIVGAPTVRAADGLAMSSRNRYLSEVERAVAPRVHAALLQAKGRVEAGDADLDAIEAEGLEALASAGMKPDYFSIRDAGTLESPALDARELVVLAAARLGKARLIDNLRITRR